MLWISGIIGFLAGSASTIALLAALGRRRKRTRTTPTRATGPAHTPTHTPPQARP